MSASQAIFRTVAAVTGPVNVNEPVPGMPVLWLVPEASVACSRFSSRVEEVAVVDGDHDLRAEPARGGERLRWSGLLCRRRRGRRGAAAAGSAGPEPRSSPARRVGCGGWWRCSSRSGGVRFAPWWRRFPCAGVRGGAGGGTRPGGGGVLPRMGSVPSWSIASVHCRATRATKSVSCSAAARVRACSIRAGVLRMAWWRTRSRARVMMVADRDATVPAATAAASSGRSGGWGCPVIPVRGSTASARASRRRASPAPIRNRARRNSVVFRHPSSRRIRIRPGFWSPAAPQEPPWPDHSAASAVWLVAQPMGPCTAVASPHPVVQPTPAPEPCQPAQQQRPPAGSGPRPRPRPSADIPWPGRFPRRWRRSQPPPGSPSPQRRRPPSNSTLRAAQGIRARSPDPPPSDANACEGCGSGGDTAQARTRAAAGPNSRSGSGQSGPPQRPSCCKFPHGFHGITLPRGCDNLGRPAWKPASRRRTKSDPLASAAGHVHSARSTCSPHAVSGPSWPSPKASHMARWHMKWPGAAPCQCSSPGGV